MKVEIVASVLPRPPLGEPPVVPVPRPRPDVLPNGLRVWSLLRPAVGQVVIRIVLPVGAVADAAERAGMAAFTGRMLLEGTTGRSADEINRELDSLGASLNVHVGHDFASVAMVLLPETLREGLALLGETLARPSFPDREMERVRAETLDAIAARRDEPAAVADDRYAAELFGMHHPYGHPTWGAEAAVRRFRREDLAEHHRRWFRPGGSLLVAVGAFDPTELRDALASALGPWHGDAPPRPVLPEPGAPNGAGRDVRVRWPDAEQAELRVGSPGLARTSPDWFAAQVANYLLGGSTITGRLGQNLREAKGWTYGVRSAFGGGIQRGGWTVETAVDDAVAEDALAEIAAETGRMAREPVDADELRRAHDALVLGLARAWETAESAVSRLVTRAAFGLPGDYWERLPERIRAVSSVDVQRIAREHFAPERALRVVVGSAAG